MPTLFIGLLALALMLWLLKSFARSDPRYLIRVGRTAGGIVMLAGAAFLTLREQFAVAITLGMTGLSLLGLQGGCRRGSALTPGRSGRKAVARCRACAPISWR